MSTTGTVEEIGAFLRELNAHQRRPGWTEDTAGTLALMQRKAVLFDRMASESTHDAPAMRAIADKARTYCDELRAKLREQYADENPGLDGAHGFMCEDGGCHGECLAPAHTDARDA